MLVFMAFINRMRKLMSESSREDFVRLAEKRVNNAIKTLRLIGNLSNKSNYSYTDEDVNKIFRSLERELKNARLRFESGKGADTPSLTLD
jgi:hypothetical protein